LFVGIITLPAWIGAFRLAQLSAYEMRDIVS
jgi:hypothetical protein